MITLTNQKIFGNKEEKDMKRISLFTLLWGFTFLLFAQDVTYNKTVDEIWGGRVFMELNGRYAGVSRNDAGISWPTNDKTVMVYCLRVPRGHVRADAITAVSAIRSATSWCGRGRRR